LNVHGRCAQVAWCRYLISFRLELADKKVRPSGSPPRDAGLAALGQSLCGFPEHAPDCGFAAFFARCAAPAALSAHLPLLAGLC
jgi:hypothetical protein